MSAAIDRAVLAQRRAAAPDACSWVSANAGSGKTRVLTERVARLLLAGAAPARILCLTYTKAAAAEMANRLAEMLGGWALLDDAALRAALRELAGDAAGRLDATALARARRLFAQALETPGGLKIQTIHAFCDAVLRRFPLEAGVSPAFEVLDEAGVRDLTLRARDRLAEDAAAGRSDAFDLIAAHLAEEGLESLLREILAARDLFTPPAAPARICAAFGIAAGDLGDAPMSRVFDGADQDALSRAAALLADGSATEARVGAPLAAALRTGDTDALGQALRKTDGGPRDFSKLPLKATDAAHPWIRPLLSDLSERFEALATRAAAIAAANRALALSAFGAAFIEAYAAEKRARGVLDFDDLIAGARRLLTRSDMAAWALYKLDGGLDHILVDEAQDTAPAQWDVIAALAGEFHAGEGARGAGRTLFVVGDEKQSIYSFQGAEPRRFGEMQRFFAARLRDAGRPLGELTLTTSFRSAPAILRVVDGAFAEDCEGLSAHGAPPMHAAAWPGRGGRVDLWPLLPKDPDAPEPEWSEPVDAPAPANPRLRLARLLAAEIGRWIAEGEMVPGEGRPVTPGDILVLVRRRDLLASELVRALKRLEIPVAGADRLRIGEELAVRDLLALARFALTPGDDLSLAALLRSPLCGLSEDEVFALAHGREGPLWNSLRAARTRHPEVAAMLGRAQARADFLRPHEFLEWALTVEDGRARLLARLGMEAEDAIDELIAQALAYETVSTPTLEGFLDWLGRSAVEIRREFDKGRGEVRVMTVHGAKGLEAPVVILPDTLPGRGPRGASVMRLEDVGGRFAAWSAPAAATPGALADAKAEAARLDAEESRRLLYVAMTRAARWLVICGAGEPAKGESWHGLAAKGMAAAQAVEIPAPAGLGGAMLRAEDIGEAPAAGEAAAGAAPAPPLPGWLRAPAPALSAPLIRREVASGLGGDAGAGRRPGATISGGTDRETARRRGDAIHALLERLPATPGAQRAARARTLLERIAPWADAGMRADMAREAIAAIGAPGAASAFAPDALAEVAVSLALPAMRVAGRIDRLSVGPERVLAVDFKTDAAPPAAPDGVPEPYLRQMAAYRAALTALYPGREVTLALLWTATPALMPLPGPLLDAALARIGSS
jgi:ATP-dependent helicase/nuclease subunit A